MVFASCLTVVIIQVISNGTHQSAQPFVRIFSKENLRLLNAVPVREAAYLVGETGDRIYLGSYDYPLLLQEYVQDLSRMRQAIVSIPNSVPSRFTAMTIDSGDLYVSDMKSHTVVKGSSETLAATDILSKGDFFVDVVGIGSRSLAFRTWDENRQEFVLAKRQKQIERHAGLLEKQIDGKFCTDGMLRYHPGKQRLVYTYFYRNQFICMDTSLNLLYRASTIDTTSRVRIEVAEIRSEKFITLSTPPRIVNRLCRLWSNYVGILSTVRSSAESKSAFRSNSVIDIYHLNNGQYNFSFYIPNYRSRAVRDFRIHNDRLFALYEEYFVVYTIPDHWPLF